MAKENTALIKADHHDLAASDLGITLEDLRKHYAPTATDKEFIIFADTLRANGLDVRKKEAYFIKYNNSPAQIVVAYPVYLKRAERSGQLDGWDVKVETANGKPTKAILTIYRKDWSKPFVWEVLASEFLKDQATHRTMPSFILRKVAIAQGFRICFSDELGGMPYTSEEISTFADENTGREALAATAGASAPASQQAPAAIAKPAASRASRVVTPAKAAPVAKPKPEPEAEPAPETQQDDQGGGEVTDPDEVLDPEGSGDSEQQEQPEEQQEQPPRDDSPKLTPEGAERIVNAFKIHKIAKQLLESVLGTTSANWTQNHREWLIDRHTELEDGSIDAKAFAALRYG